MILYIYIYIYIYNQKLMINTIPSTAFTTDPIGPRIANPFAYTYEKILTVAQ